MLLFNPLSFSSFQLLLHLSASALALPTDQQPLSIGSVNKLQNVRKTLKKAEIIPTVIQDFHPYISLTVSWGKSHAARLGNTIAPKHLQDEPTITLYDATHDATTSTQKKSNVTYVVTLTDPDAPSRDNPKWSEFCHWIAANVSLTEPSGPWTLPIMNRRKASSHKSSTTPDNVVDYKPPGPPEETGKHRYVFLVFAPRNSTSAPLHLSAPKERKHWGTGEERGGVRDWAKENGLVPVGANFIYAQNEKQ